MIMMLLYKWFGEVNRNILSGNMIIENDSTDSKIFRDVLTYEIYNIQSIIQGG